MTVGGPESRAEEEDQGRSDGGVYTLPKSGHVNYGVRMASERLLNFLYPPKYFYTSPKQISGYAPEEHELS